MTMLRALVWKEWREQRALLAGGAVLAMGLPVVLFFVAALSLPYYSGQGLTDVTALAFVLMLWPVFAAAAGAGTLANEATGRTAGFLLSRPASRARVWLVKVAVAVGIVLAVIAFSLLVAALLQRAVGAPDAVGASMLVFRGSIADRAGLLIGAPALFLCFAAAIFLSSRVTRPLAAAIGGLIVAIVLLGALVLLSGRVGLVIEAQPSWVAAETALAGVVLLGLSLRRFVRAEILTTSSVRSTVALLVAVGAIILVCGMAPMAYGELFIDLDHVQVRDLTVSPDGSAAVATALRYRATIGSLWRLPDEVATPAAGSEPGDAPAPPTKPVRLTRRLAFAPFFSRDGEWVYYFSTGRFAGVHGAEVALRVVRIDGSEDHAVVESIGRITRTGRAGAPMLTRAVLSQSGSKAAFATGWWGEQPLVVDLQQGAVIAVVDPVPGRFPRYSYASGTPVSWLGDDLLLYVWGRENSNAAQWHALVRYDLDSGHSQTVFPPPGRSASPATSGYSPLAFPPDGYLRGTSLVMWRYVAPQPIDGDPSRNFVELSEVDLDTGEPRTLERFPCGYPDATVSADGTTIAYRRFASCVERGVGSEPILVLRDLRTGVAADIDDWRNQPDLDLIRISPSGQHAFVRTGPGRRGAYIVSAGSVARAISLPGFTGNTGPFLRNAGWIDENRLLLSYTTGDVIPIYPPQPQAAVIIDATDGSILHEFIIPRSLATSLVR